MRIASGLILCCLSMTAAAAERCDRTPLDAYLERGRDLLIGELHGTAESPALIRCLVLNALARKNAEPLVVSLEHTPAARDLASEDWKSPDGRSSIAMWELAEFLFEQEKLGRLRVSFHVPAEFPMKADNTPDMAEYEKRMGAPLREIADKHLLIALIGNFHTMKTRPPGMSYDPAGIHVGDAALHVSLDSVAPGTAWNTMNNESKSRSAGGSFSGQEPNTLVDGNFLGHDFIFLLPRFTASGPKYPNAAVSPQR